MPANGQIARELLTPQKTKGYTASMSVASGGYSWHNGESGTLTYSDIQRMLMGDGHIQFCLRALAAPIMHATWTVYANSQEVARFIDSQLKRFWDNELRKVVPSVFAWGARGGEKIFIRNADRHIVLDGLKVIHPQDIKPLQIDGNWAGVQVQGVQGGMANLGKFKGYWFLHEDEYGTLYGTSRLHAVRPIWQEKHDPKGAIPSRRTWHAKYAFRGGNLYVPPGGEQDASGKEVSYMDNARQTLEQAEAGATMVFPSTRTDGERDWEFVDPQGNKEPGSILEYPKELDKEMARAIGVPPEVLEATGETGSGYAGRSIPLMVFYDGLDGETRQRIHEFGRQIGDYEVLANFGPERYRIETDSLMPKEQDKDGKGSPPPSAGPGMGAPGGQQPGMISLSLESKPFSYSCRNGKVEALPADVGAVHLSVGPGLAAVQQQLTVARAELANLKPAVTEQINLALDAGVQRVFFYGTLRDGAARHRALGHESHVTVAGLPGFTRTGTAEWPDVMPRAGEEVSGSLLLADRWDLERLINYENEDGYKPRRVMLTDGQPAWMFTRLAGQLGQQQQEGENKAAQTTGQGGQDQGEATHAKAVAISDLIGAIYGNGAPEMLDQMDHGKSVQMSLGGQIWLAAWMPDLHPRWPKGSIHPKTGKPCGGKFIEKESKEAMAVVHGKIATALKAPHDPNAAADLLNHLNLLTPAQIHEVRVSSGIQHQEVAGHTREQLVQKVHQRLVSAHQEASKAKLEAKPGFAEKKAAAAQKLMQMRQGGTATPGAPAQPPTSKKLDYQPDVHADIRAQKVLNKLGGQVDKPVTPKPVVAPVPKPVPKPLSKPAAPVARDVALQQEADALKGLMEQVSGPARDKLQDQYEDRMARLRLLKAKGSEEPESAKKPAETPVAPAAQPMAAAAQKTVTPPAPQPTATATPARSPEHAALAKQLRELEPEFTEEDVNGMDEKELASNIRSRASDTGKQPVGGSATTLSEDKDDSFLTKEQHEYATKLTLQISDAKKKGDKKLVKELEAELDRVDPHNQSVFGYGQAKGTFVDPRQTVSEPEATSLKKRLSGGTAAERAVQSDSAEAAAPAQKPEEKPTVTPAHLKQAHADLKAGKLPIKGNAKSEPVTSDLSGEPIRRHVTLPGGQKVHPDELHRLKADEEGGVSLHPHENIEVKDATAGHGTQKTFGSALQTVTGISGHDDDPVTLTSPHGYTATKTRGEWRDVAKEVGSKPGSFGSWFDHNSEMVSDKAKAASEKPASSLASDEESKQFFEDRQPVQNAESLFDAGTKPLGGAAKPAAAPKPAEAAKEVPHPYAGMSEVEKLKHLNTMGEMSKGHEQAIAKYRKQMDDAYTAMKPQQQKELQQAIINGVRQNLQEKTVPPPNDKLYQMVAKQLPTATKQQLVGALHQMSDDGQIVLKGWPRTTDEIPDKDVIGMGRTGHLTYAANGPSNDPNSLKDVLPQGNAAAKGDEQKPASLGGAARPQHPARTPTGIANAGGHAAIAEAKKRPENPTPEAMEKMKPSIKETVAKSAAKANQAKAEQKAAAGKSVDDLHRLYQKAGDLSVPQAEFESKLKAIDTLKKPQLVELAGKIGRIVKNKTEPQIRELLRGTIKENRGASQRSTMTELPKGGKVEPAKAETPKAAEKPVANEQKELQESIKSAYNHQTLFKDYQNGLVDFPALFDRVKQVHPEMTTDQFHQAVEGLRDNGEMEAHILNEERRRSDKHPGLGIRAKGVREGDIGSLYYYLMSGKKSRSETGPDVKGAEAWEVRKRRLGK